MSKGQRKNKPKKVHVNKYENQIGQIKRKTPGRSPNLGHEEIPLTPEPPAVPGAPQLDYSPLEVRAQTVAYSLPRTQAESKTRSQNIAPNDYYLLKDKEFSILMGREKRVFELWEFTHKNKVTYTSAGTVTLENGRKYGYAVFRPHLDTSWFGPSQVKEINLREALGKDTFRQAYEIDEGKRLFTYLDDIVSGNQTIPFLDSKVVAKTETSTKMMYAYDPNTRYILLVGSSRFPDSDLTMSMFGNSDHLPETDLFFKLGYIPRGDLSARFEGINTEDSSQVEKANIELIASSLNIKPGEIQRLDLSSLRKLSHGGMVYLNTNELNRFRDIILGHLEGRTPLPSLEARTEPSYRTPNPKIKNY